MQPVKQYLFEVPEMPSLYNSTALSLELCVLSLSFLHTDAFYYSHHHSFIRYGFSQGSLNTKITHVLFKIIILKPGEYFL